ncbi:hypothetical protein L2E82_49934 [Cichorium intybus]|nr:hypothetical protein L2E82_49934 [Cichorium intybus]
MTLTSYGFGPYLPSQTLKHLLLPHSRKPLPLHFFMHFSDLIPSFYNHRLNLDLRPSLESLEDNFPHSRSSKGLLPSYR